ncbi:TIM-barrel domain-containing protein [Rubrolithibacter danxiaensis]|uniref:TIM-barrel domain-containing protein n=1 Tax=Rubrolithibacter danxiaensis TaxID=3390805 RepID=UPI003BF791C4
MKNYSLVFLFLIFSSALFAQKIDSVAPGIWKISYGIPQQHLPDEFKEPLKLQELKNVSAVDKPPFDLKDVQFRLLNGGVLAEMKVEEAERFYGFGMQTNSFEQRGMRREIRTNSWTAGNVGFGHASMPFYISSKGYGVLVNSSRYVTFYMASKGKLDDSVKKQIADQKEKKIALSTVDLYGKSVTPSNEVSIHINGTQGIELYIFAGPQMKEVLQRYNLFSGGGSLPPMWGLGFKYRAKATFTDQQVLETADYFRKNKIPCDVIGLEPGWQTAAYSCSFIWNKKNYPDPYSLTHKINDQGFKLNLWEHAYTHPSSPIFNKIVPYSADYTVWGGAVPDFITPQGREIFTTYHENEFLKKGIAAFKLDECDAANFELAHREWSFPDIAEFPSGLDGEQMRQLFGLLYQKSMLEMYKKNNIRTMFDVRASYLFASPYNSALYSDMYSHGDFVRMIVNSGFAGVNWSPELRETSSEADLIRRLQTTVMSSQMVANCWYLDLPPWLQYDADKNTRHELLPNHKELEVKAKKLIELRMRLIPYLYSAFAKYHFQGVPPFRALVVDFPKDKEVWKIDDQYLMGDNIMCAPFIDGSSTRKIYFPEGIWYDFNTNKKYEGGKSYTITMSLDEIPMFIKDSTILPLAEPVQFISPSTTFKIHCKVYGDPHQPVHLFSDNSTNLDFEKGLYSQAELLWKRKKGKVTYAGKYPEKRYKVVSWEVVK